MAEFLLVADEVAPVGTGESAVCAGVLARALSSAKHTVTIVSLAAPERAAGLPGLARRLRTVAARTHDWQADLSLYEGRSAVSQCALYVLATEPHGRGRQAALLACAATSLVSDGICRPDAIIGWGEASAYALASTPATSARCLFFLPTGLWGAPLGPKDLAEFGADDPAVALSRGHLVALGAIEADAVALPSPSAAAVLVRAPELACRASDQPVVAIRLGCDELPNDPATDPALPAAFSAESPAGKVECRRVLARRASLALGPRTLLLATGPLDPARDGRSLLDALAQLGRADVAVVIPAGGDRALTDQARLLAIESPGKLAVLPEAGPDAERQMLAGAEAILLADRQDYTGRAAGLALRYGALPLAPSCGANADYLVDRDVASDTGCALLYRPGDAWNSWAAVQRAVALRANADLWHPIVTSLLRAAPRWAATAAAVEETCLNPPTGG